MSVTGEGMSLHPQLSARFTILCWAVTGEGTELQLSTFASECLLHFNTYFVDPESVCSTVAKLDNSTFHFIA